MSAPTVRLRRSRFVSGLAWLTIVGSAGGLAGGAVWTLVLAASGGDVSAFTDDATVAAMLPPTARFILAHLLLVSVVCIAAGAVMLATGVGLLRRREWARVATIWILGAGILGSLAGSLTPSRFTVPGSALAALPDSTRALFQQQIAAAAEGTRVLGILAFIVMAAVNGLVIAKLASAGVRAEFDAADGDAA